VFAAHLETLVPGPLQKLRRLHAVRRPRTENETARKTRENIARHYDLSNQMFALFLDPSMTYSAALFDRNPDADPEQPTTAPHHERALPDMRNGAPGVIELQQA